MGKFDLPADYEQKMSNRAAFDATAVEKALLKLLAAINELTIGQDLFSGEPPLNTDNIALVLTGDDPGSDLRIRQYEFECSGSDRDSDRLVKRISRLAGTLPLQGITVDDIYLVSVYRNGSVHYNIRHIMEREFAHARLSIRVKAEVNQ